MSEQETLRNIIGCLAALDSLQQLLFMEGKKMPYLFKLLTDTEYVHLNVGTCSGIRFRGMLSSKAGSLNLNILVMWGRMILCYGGLSCAL